MDANGHYFETCGDRHRATALLVLSGCWVESIKGLAETDPDHNKLRQIAAR